MSKTILKIVVALLLIALVWHILHDEPTGEAD